MEEALLSNFDQQKMVSITIMILHFIIQINMHVAFNLGAIH